MDTIEFESANATSNGIVVSIKHATRFVSCLVAAMSEKSDDLYLPNSVIMRIVREAVSSCLLLPVRSISCFKLNKPLVGGGITSLLVYAEVEWLGA